MKKNLKHSILSEFDSEVLFECGCLCSDGAVSILSFIDLISPEKTHEITESVERLALQGYIKYFDGEISSNDNQSTPSIPLTRGMLGRLVEKTSISIFDDRMSARDYFLMAYSFAKFVEKILPKVDYSLYAQLACNLSAYIDLWYPNSLHAATTEELPIVRILRLAVSKISSDSTIASRLHAHISIFFTNAWRYNDAQYHLKIIENFKTGWTYMAYGEYYYNYGQIARALHCWMLAFEMNDDEYTKAFSSAKIALLLALIGETESARNWLDINCDYFKYLPENHELRASFLLTLALLENDLVSATHWIDCAELLVVKLNRSETPLGGLIHYVQSQLFEAFGYHTRSLSEYKKYVRNSFSNFKASDGGWLIYYSTSIESALDKGELVTAKNLSICYLDSIVDLYSTELAFSVRSEVCHAYVQLYKKLHLYCLALTYKIIADELTKMYKPSQMVLDSIEPLFSDGVPTVISLDTAGESRIEQIAIEIDILEANQSSIKREDIWYKISHFGFNPALTPWLFIVEGRLLAQKDIHEAIVMWHNAFLSSEGQVYWIARECGKAAASYGLIYEAVEMYSHAMKSDTYTNMPDYLKFEPLLEYVLLLEQAGFRSKAQTYWAQLEEISNEEQIGFFNFNRAIVEYNHQQWTSSRKYLELFFSKYKQTEQFDELISTAYNYYCSVLLEVGEYEAALDAINKSLALWIAPESFETFPLFCNKAHCEIALNDFSSARKTLKQAERCVGGNAKNKQILGELCDYLDAQRRLYYKQ